MIYASSACIDYIENLMPLQVCTPNKDFVLVLVDFHHETAGNAICTVFVVR